MLNIICHQGNVNQNHEISFYTSQNGYDLKKKKKNKCWQGCGEIEYLLSIYRH